VDPNEECYFQLSLLDSVDQRIKKTCKQAAREINDVSSNAKIKRERKANKSEENAF